MLTSSLYFLGVSPFDCAHWMVLLARGGSAGGESGGPDRSLTVVALAAPLRAGLASGKCFRGHSCGCNSWCGQPVMRAFPLFLNSRLL